jgi:capsular polysaccharide biosynthesis protein
MKKVRDDGAVLLRDVDTTDKTYQMLQARATQSSIESQANQGGAYILSEAVPPIEPSSPKLALNLAVAVFLGALLALGTGLMLEMLDRRVRGLADLADDLGLPVLGVLPPAGGRRSSRQQALMQERVMGRLPAPSRGA